MVIFPIRNTSFDEGATQAMGAAFDQACRVLRHFGAADTVQKIIAMRIVESAEAGERDPVRLRNQALQELGIDTASMPEPA
jgi:aspartate carbamoyltransferase regulatory subunit